MNWTLFKCISKFGDKNINLIKIYGENIENVNNNKSIQDKSICSYLEFVQLLQFSKKI